MTKRALCATSGFGPGEGAMLHAGGALMIVALAFWVYCLLDVIATDQSMIRNLPKVPWVLIVLLFNPVGGIAWLLLGRPTGTSFAPGSIANRGSTRPLPSQASGPAPKGPDDADDFLADLDRRRRREQEERERLRAWEEDLRRREDELRGQQEDPDR